MMTPPQPGPKTSTLIATASSLTEQSETVTTPMSQLTTSDSSDKYTSTPASSMLPSFSFAFYARRNSFSDSNLNRYRVEPTGSQSARQSTSGIDSVESRTAADLMKYKMRNCGDDEQRLSIDALSNTASMGSDWSIRRFLHKFASEKRDVTNGDINALGPTGY